jgi:hypothetical protein
MTRWAIAAVFFALSGCSTTPADRRPSEFFDEHTAATVTVVDQPLVFARKRSDLGANLNDFVTVSAVSVNRGGKYEYVLVTYVWTTTGVAANTGAGELMLTADDRRISLEEKGMTLREAGVSVPVHPPAAVSSVAHVTHTDRATIAFIALARTLSVTSATPQSPEPYELFDDQRASLQAFVDFIGGKH